MKERAQKDLTLVAFYGRKRAPIRRIVKELKEQIAGLLGRRFEPYGGTQVHATIIGLEGWRIRNRLVNANYAELRGKSKAMDLGGVLRSLHEMPNPLFTVEIGGFKREALYPFASRGLHPYYRSFAVQGEIAVVMGWPVEDHSYPMSLDMLRRGFQQYGVLHKYHATEDQLDNDFYLVLGRVDRARLSQEKIDKAEEMMRFYMAEKMCHRRFTVNVEDLSLVAHEETTLSPRKSKRFSLENAEKNLEEIVSLYPSVRT